MLKTRPIQAKDGEGATKVFVRFRSLKTPNMFHHLGESLGAMIIRVSRNELEYQLAYLNASGIVLKIITYERAIVEEVTLEESVCEIYHEQSTR